MVLVLRGILLILRRQTLDKGESQSWRDVAKAELRQTIWGIIVDNRCRRKADIAKDRWLLDESITLIGSGPVFRDLETGLSANQKVLLSGLRVSVGCCCLNK